MTALELWSNQRMYRAGRFIYDADDPPLHNVRLLSAIQRFTADGASSSYDFDGEMEAAVGKAQDILKAEWKRVKRGR